MKHVPDPERLLRGYYADELRLAARGVRHTQGISRSRGESPVRTLLVAAASLAIITGSALTVRPVVFEARGIPFMAAALTEFAEVSGLLGPFKSWATEIDEQEDHDDA
jgi:hypothetical protein